MQPLGLLFHLSVSFSFFLVLLPFPFPPPHPPRSALYRLGCAFLFIQSHISCFLPLPPPLFKLVLFSFAISLTFSRLLLKLLSSHQPCSLIRSYCYTHTHT